MTLLVMMNLPFGEVQMVARFCEKEQREDGSRRGDCLFGVGYRGLVAFGAPGLVTAWPP